MPTSSLPKTKPKPKIVQTSARLDVIDNWLRKMLDRFPQKGQLTTSEIEDWHRDLAGFSLGAIEFAFEQMRLGIFFPMNGQVLDLCLSYEPADAPIVQSNSTCDALCKSRHGKGYYDADMIWVFGKAVRIYKAGDTPDYDALLTEVDERRPDGPPEFRR